jgi:hypothetical protein
MKRQRLLLAGLAGVLMLCLAYAYWAMPRQEVAPPRASAPAAQGGSASKPQAAGKGAPASGRLKLELLDAEPEPLPESGRDIFRFRGGLVPTPVAPEVAAPPEVIAPPPPPPPPTAEQLLQ